MRRISLAVRKSGGIILALGGILLIVKTVPLYLWPLLIGAVFVWIGWQLYTYNAYYW